MHNNPPLKVGVIGAGNIAQTVHIPGYLSYSKPVTIEALCSRSPDRMQAAAEKFRIPHTFTEPAQMLAQCSLDAVSICTPNAFHFDGAMKALAAGCHVFCEKPPALTAAQAGAMAACAAAAKRVLAYNLTQRQLPEIAVLKNRIDQGEFGSIYHIKASFLRRRGIPGWGSFTSKEVQGGGALTDIGIHVLDLALYLYGYPALHSVLASTYDYIGKAGGHGELGSWDGAAFTVEDACFAHIRLQGGCSIMLETAFALNTERSRYFNLEIFGTKAGATLSPFKIFTVEGAGLVYTEPSVSAADAQQQSVHRFLDACNGCATNLCTAQEGAVLQEVIESIYSSADVV